MNTILHTIIVGDIKLNYNKKHDVDKSRKHYFAALDILLEKLNLTQILNFDTWSRINMNQKRSSVINNVYINNHTRASN